MYDHNLVQLKLCKRLRQNKHWDNVPCSTDLINMILGPMYGHHLVQLKLCKRLLRKGNWDKVTDRINVILFMVTTWFI